MVSRFPVLWHRRSLDIMPPAPFIKALIIVVPNALSRRLDFIMSLKLGVEHSRQDLRGQVTGTEIHPCILLRPGRTDFGWYPSRG